MARGRWRVSPVRSVREIQPSLRPSPLLQGARRISSEMNGASDDWPSLSFAEWKDTAITLHMWTQIVGKIRLTLTPWTNHSWHVTLYLTARGLTTSPIPHRAGIFEIRFDFIDHELRILKSDGAMRVIELRPKSVAAFYREVMAGLSELKIDTKINTTPNEVEPAIPFEQDDKHR